MKPVFTRGLRWGLSALALMIMAPTSATERKATDTTPVSQVALPTEHGLAEAAQQFLIKYPSISGVDGKSPRQDTAAVFIPKGEAPHGGWPVVVWTHGTIGVDNACAPSLNARTARDSQYLNTWLSLGFAIVAPDYAGLGSDGLHHYLNARAEAWSVLDSVRAALKAFPLQNSLIFVGQSQGAHAAFASAGYQPQYAPELNVRATVLTGTPYFDADTSAAQVFTGAAPGNAQSGDPKIPYVFYIYLAAADSQKSLKSEDYFQPAAQSLLAKARELCITPLTEEVMKQKLNAANSLKPAIQSVLESTTDVLRYPTLHIQHPVFIGIGGEDINVPTAMQQHFAQAVKAAGTQVDIHEYPELDHSGTVNPSLRDSVPFILKTLGQSF